jgi:hypothetical protein
VRFSSEAHVGYGLFGARVARQYLARGGAAHDDGSHVSSLHPAGVQHPSRLLAQRGQFAGHSDQESYRRGAPVFWGKNQSGMAARAEIGDAARERAQIEWKRALDHALASAERLASPDIDLHKQLVNRILEPFAWITVIVSATEWANFFTQRCHPDAQPEIHALAELMLAAYRASTPREIPLESWHLPLVQPDERGLDSATLRKLSVARCARVSYLTHDNVRDIGKDLELYERLMSGGANGHWSPTEHVATPLDDPHETCANFRGWKQFRKLFGAENAATFPDEIARTG